MIEAKDLLLQVGVTVTFVLGLVNLYFNIKAAKRTSFINTVTSERIKWIAKVRENVATLCSPCDQWIHHRSQANAPELQRQIERLKNGKKKRRKEEKAERRKGGKKKRRKKRG